MEHHCLSGLLCPPTLWLTLLTDSGKAVGGEDTEYLAILSDHHRENREWETGLERKTPNGSREGWPRWLHEDHSQILHEDSDQQRDIHMRHHRTPKEAPTHTNTPTLHTSPTDGVMDVRTQAHDIKTTLCVLMCVSVSLSNLPAWFEPVCPPQTTSHACQSLMMVMDHWSQHMSPEPSALH